MSTTDEGSKGPGAKGQGSKGPGSAGAGSTGAGSTRSSDTGSTGGGLGSDLRGSAASGLDKASGLLGGLFESARKGLGTLQDATKTTDRPEGIAFARGLEFAQQHVTAAFEHAQTLVHSKDVTEAVKMQAEYLQKQYQAMKAQAEELTEIVKAKVADATSSSDTTAPDAKASDTKAPDTKTDDTKAPGAKPSAKA